MSTPRRNALSDLNALLGECRKGYEACVDVLDFPATTQTPIASTARFHHLRFNGNAEPMVEELAACLATHVIEYCFAAGDRPTSFSAQDAMKYAMEARRLFRKTARGKKRKNDTESTGEAGELL